MSLSNDMVLGMGEYHVTLHRHMSTYHLIPANNNPCHTKENVMSYITNVTHAQLWRTMCSLLSYVPIGQFVHLISYEMYTVRTSLLLTAQPACV